MVGRSAGRMTRSLIQGRISEFSMTPPKQNLCRFAGTATGPRKTTEEPYGGR